MKGIEEVKLIEGEFDPIEAKELLLNIIGSKIQFHTTRNFSSEICLGKSDKKSVEKLISLREARQKIVDLLEEASKNDLMVDIQSSINISYRLKEVQKRGHSSR